MKRLAVAVTALLILTSCASSADSLPSEKRLKVVASIYPLFEAVGTVGGTRVHAANLLPLDPFGPLTPAKAAQLRDAPLAIILGKGTQPAVEEVAAQRTKPTVRVLDVIDTEQYPPESGLPGVDPHVWLSPQQMAKIIEQVRIALVSVDPEGAKKYARNSKNYGAVIAAIDKNYARTIATCDRTDVVTTDPRFQYLTDRFGLAQRVIKPDDASLQSAIDRYNPKTVFFREIPDLDEARRIHETYGVSVAALDPIAEHTDQARRGGANYGSIMAINLDALRGALGCISKLPPGK